MIDATTGTIVIQNAIERLRQEKETFEQLKRQHSYWFYLRLLMGYVAVCLLPFIAYLCGHIMMDADKYSGGTVTAATAALLVDVLGLVIAIWKVVLNQDSVAKLTPVTEIKDINRIPPT